MPKTILISKLKGKDGWVFEDEQPADKYLPDIRELNEFHGLNKPKRRLFQMTKRTIIIEYEEI